MLRSEPPCLASMAPPVAGGVRNVPTPYSEEARRNGRAAISWAEQGPLKAGPQVPVREVIAVPLDRSAGTGYNAWQMS